MYFVDLTPNFPQISMTPNLNSQRELNMQFLQKMAIFVLVILSVNLNFCLADPCEANENKVEPILIEESNSLNELNVIVFIESPDLETISKEVKARYKPQLDNLSENIKAIERKYRPKRSLTPDEEKSFLIEQETVMTEEDRTKLETLQERLDKKLDKMRREIGLALRQAVQPNQDKVANFIVSRGGIITSKTAVISTIGATIPSNSLIRLANHPLVVSIMKDRPTQLELDVSIPTCDFDTWWNDGFNGGVWDFGIVDTGVQQDHPAFSAVRFFTNSGSNSDSGGHGTHVTGIVASADATYRGGAYGLDAVIWSYAGGSSNQSLTMANMEWQAASAYENPEVINHSLGYGTANDTDYSNNDAFYDAFIRHYDILVTKSAGNEGWSDTAPTITHPATAYNLLAVANMNDQNTISRSDDVRRESSSVGPTLNDRKKPDITAPGTDIMSCNNDWSSSSDFVSMTGTSMAAPHVAAAILLLQDGGNYDSLAQKAVLINTADAWDSKDTSTTADDGPVDGSHWDKSYGWGYLDMWEAHFNRSDYFVDSIVPNNYNATPDDYKLYKGYMYADEKATLVWEKRASYVAGSPPSTQYRLSDLDLYLYNESNGDIVDSDIDTNDNVHQVSAPSDINAVIKVFAYDSSFDGASSETYALATEENFVRADPPSFDISLSMPSSVNANTQFTVTANVTNIGDVAAHNNRVTLRLPSGFSIISGSNPQNIGKIPAGSTGQATWTVRSSNILGTGNLSASNESLCYGEIYRGDSLDTPITVIKSMPWLHLLLGD